MFFKYFEDTWFSLDEEKEEIYQFSLWSYYGKFDMEIKRVLLISERKLNDYVFLSNKRLEIILKTLFIRLKFQKDNDGIHIERKQQLSDILLELIKQGYGVKKGLITNKEMNIINKFKSEFDIFKLTFD